MKYKLTKLAVLFRIHDYILHMPLLIFQSICPAFSPTAPYLCSEYERSLSYSASNCTTKSLLYTTHATPHFPKHMSSILTNCSGEFFRGGQLYTIRYWRLMGVFPPPSGSQICRLRVGRCGLRESVISIFVSLQVRQLSRDTDLKQKSMSAQQALK
ncbi:hypothetical protein DL98DRAFT_275215 [Cadophora sp. DSE1049]|nr:hypothetical protein DL98DRAFT_275215 [Cadophora sp. DSE1049]